MRQFTDEQLTDMDKETAEAELVNRVYAAACFADQLEHAGKFHGNGHHFAQKIAAFALEQLREQWKGSTPP